MYIMIKNYVLKLMENLPENITNSKSPMKIDLIISGGAFNGSYILGSLFFLKEMEKKNYLTIKRISTCSISSIIALFYLTDNLDKANELYFLFKKELSNKFNFSKLLSIKEILKNIIKPDDYIILNKKLYISFNDVSSLKKHVVCKFKNNDHLFDIIIRSCFLPFLIDYNPCYKDKYMDGITPYFFKTKQNNSLTCSNRRRIYLDVCTLDKLFYAISVKNEKTNYHRLFEGLLDIHKFFIKNCNTTMCSDLDKWTMYNYLLYYIWMFIEKILLYFICFINKIKSYSLFSKKYKYFKTNIGKMIKFFLLNQCL